MRNFLVIGCVAAWAAGCSHRSHTTDALNRSSYYAREGEKMISTPGRVEQRNPGPATIDSLSSTNYPAVR